MKRTRHPAEQVIRKLKTAEQLIAQGKTVADVCRAIEVTLPTFYRWRQPAVVMINPPLTEVEPTSDSLTGPA